MLTSQSGVQRDSRKASRTAASAPRVSCSQWRKGWNRRHAMAPIARYPCRLPHIMPTNGIACRQFDAPARQTEFSFRPHLHDRDCDRFDARTSQPCGGDSASASRLLLLSFNHQIALGLLLMDVDPWVLCELENQSIHFEVAGNGYRRVLHCLSLTSLAAPLMWLRA